MKREQALRVQSIAFTLADGAAVVFPVIAPFVKSIEAILLAAENNMITPVELSKEQAASIAAGVEALKASAVTSVMEHQKKKT